MTDHEKTRLRIIPGGMRNAFREKQIEAIREAFRKDYAARIRATTNRVERRCLKAACNSEIARRTDTLLREREQDGPHCL